jgi:dTDP-4-dehydrorhamnose reductase
MNILVTGAAGQLGRAMVKAAQGSDNKYIFCDRQNLDISNETAVESFVQTRNIDVIVNCASYTAVDKAEDEQETAELINTRAVAAMAEIARKHDAVLIHISTDYVFDGKACVAYTEEAPTAPLNVYGRTKADAERAVLESGCRHIILRTSWLYGVEGDNFVKRIIEKSAENPVLKVISDQIGTPTFVEDLAGLISLIIEENMLDRTGIYNYSNEGVCSWYDFAHEICAQVGHLCDVLPCHTDEYPRKAVRPHFSVLDKSKVKKTFGIEIPHWKDSLSLCIRELENIEE